MIDGGESDTIHIQRPKKGRIQGRDKKMKLEDLRGKTVGVCVSGGLDSKTICCVLKDAGVKVKEIGRASCRERV